MIGGLESIMNSPTPVEAFIKSLRRDKGLTQETLADLLGVTRTAITQWETSRSMPSESAIQKLAKLAGVDVEYLRLLKQHVELQRKGIQADNSQLMLSAEEHHVLGLLRSGDLMNLAGWAIEKAKTSGVSNRRKAA